MVRIYHLLGGCGLAACAMPTLAQYPASPYPNGQPQAQPGYVNPFAPQSDADLLAQQLRTLAANPNDLYALLNAAKLSLKVGDTDGAAALYTRANRLNPMHPQVRAGTARLLVQTGRPGEALRRFQEAERAGATLNDFGSDRALAYDLVGEQQRAQREYRALLRYGSDDETTRRYALSLGISGLKEPALALLEPLNRRSDRGAWRARAFVLAMNGDRQGAEKIATTMMPSGMGRQLEPFFDKLPRLSASERAFAVSFGETRASPTRLADARLVPPLPALSPETDPFARGAATQVAARDDADDRRGKKRKSKRERREEAARGQGAGRAGYAANVAPLPPPPAPTAAQLASLTATRMAPGYGAYVMASATSQRPTVLPPPADAYRDGVTQAAARPSTGPGASSDDDEPDFAVAAVDTVASERSGRGAVPAPAASTPVTRASTPLTATPPPTALAAAAPAQRPPLRPSSAATAAVTQTAPSLAAPPPPATVAPAGTIQRPPIVSAPTTVVSASAPGTGRGEPALAALGRPAASAPTSGAAPVPGLGDFSLSGRATTPVSAATTSTIPAPSAANPPLGTSVAGLLSAPAALPTPAPGSGAVPAVGTAAIPPVSAPAGTAVTTTAAATTSLGQGTAAVPTAPASTPVAISTATGAPPAPQGPGGDAVLAAIIAGIKVPDAERAAPRPVSASAAPTATVPAPGSTRLLANIDKKAEATDKVAAPTSPKSDPALPKKDARGRFVDDKGKPLLDAQGRVMGPIGAAKWQAEFDRNGGFATSDLPKRDARGRFVDDRGRPLLDARGRAMDPKAAAAWKADQGDSKSGPAGDLPKKDARGRFVDDKGKPLLDARGRAMGPEAAASWKAEFDKNGGFATRDLPKRDARGRFVDEKGKPLLDPRGRPLDPKAAAAWKADAGGSDVDKGGAGRGDAVGSEPARIWVQVAGGADEGALAREWKRLVAATPSLKGKQGWTTPLRATNRILTGPFASNAEAIALVNALKKDGVSGFVFSSDKGQKITRLGVK